MKVKETVLLNQEYDEITLLDGDEELTGCYFIDNESNHYCELGEGLAVVKVMNFDNFSQYWYGIVENKRHFITPILFSDFGYYDKDEGLICVCNGDRLRCWGFINKRGGVVIPFKHTFPVMFALEDPYTLILYSYRRSGDQFFSLKPHYFMDGIIVLEEDQMNALKWGVYDNGGNVIIPFDSYEIGQEFSSNRLRIKKNGLYGYIDYQGHEVINCQYSQASGFFKHNNNSWAIVSYVQYRFFIINLDGNRISDVYYNIGRPNQNGIMEAQTLNSFQRVRIDAVGRMV